MNDSIEFTLHSPLTEEDWNKLLDVELEKTTSITFQTPQGRQVKYIKCEVLDKIRAEIEQAYCKVENDYDHGRNYGLYMATQIIDKYKAEGSDKE